MRLSWQPASKMSGHCVDRQIPSHAHAKVVVKSWFRYGRVLFNFPYSKFFAATSLTGTFYRTARSLVVRAQMMVHGMSSCSSCCAHYRVGRGESVWTCLMSSFPPARTIMVMETCARPHARTSDFIAISVGLLCTHIHCRHMSATQSAKTTADAATYVSCLQLWKVAWIDWTNWVCLVTILCSK